MQITTFTALSLLPLVFLTGCGFHLTCPSRAAMSAPPQAATWNRVDQDDFRKEYEKADRIIQKFNNTPQAYKCETKYFTETEKEKPVLKKRIVRHKKVKREIDWDSIPTAKTYPVDQ